MPLVDTVREEWLALHRRAVSGGPHPRVYSAGLGTSYVPSSEACAEAIFAQANDTLNFTRVIESAWEDGVRIFVEHGPQGSCSRWIHDILGDREAVVVPLDRKGKGLDPIYEAIAALLAAGVAFDPTKLLQRLSSSASATSPTLSFPAHQAPIRGLPLPSFDTDSLSHPAQSGRQLMRPAPPLRPVLAEDLPPAQLPPIAEPAQPAKTAPVSPPRAHGSIQSSATVETHAPGSPYRSAAPRNTDSGVITGPSDPRLTALQDHVSAISQREQQHIAQQAALHQQFLEIQEQAMRLLLRGQTGSSSPPSPSTIVPLPTAAVPVPQAPSPPAPRATPPQPTLRAEIAPPTHKPMQGVPGGDITRTHAAPTPVGPTFDFAQLNVHSSGKISEIIGPEFAGQDDYHRQVRMPEPPLLLADRITGLDAEAGSMGKGTIWSESDVLADRWFMHQGHMPAGIMIESGQADLMLISYLGVDQSNRGERVYRLLGCELTYYGGLPKAGELLQYDIHMDGHATQGDVRLMFFHSDCRSDGDLRLSVRKGQAGFFTDEELADSDGCLWTPEGQELAPSPRMDAPFVTCPKSDFSVADVRAFADGRPWDCFGETLVGTMPHTRTPRIQNGPMLLLGDVTDFSTSGGPWGRGYAKSTVALDPKTWFFDGHFKNDPCMPGTLMFEGCLQLMGFYLAGLGYTVARDGWRFEPVSGEPFQLSCRGQVTPSSKVLTYELFVEEVHDGPIPTLYADLLCTVDGLKAFHARRVALQLTPSWPLDEGSSLLEGYVEPKPVALAGEFPFDYRSLIACAQGRPSEAFGPIYDRFDAPGRVARLPNPPYHFLSRVTRTAGLIGSMDDGLEVDVEYDIPEDAWYFDENGCRAMPFAVLLEAALQPCGWLASYMGCALTTTEELCFRNLDGEGRLLVDLLPHSGTLLTKVRSTRTSQMGAMIIVAFEVECSVEGTPVYELDTVFGFFPQEALENQIGLPVSDIQRASLDATSDLCIDLTQRPPGCWEADRPSLAEPMLLMLDRITGFDPTGGEAGLGTARGEKDVNPGEWFFKAHFFQDPVQPGSLGIEAMIQLLQWTMLEMKLDAGIAEPRFETLALDETMSWKYRGQVVPKNSVISSTLEITEVRHEAGSVLALAVASLWVDGKRIYEASNLGMRIVSGGTPGPRTTTLAPDTDPWLLDHCPTWTVPALPMMSMVDLLAQGACTADPVTALRDVRVAGWFVMDSQRVLHTERAGDKVRLLCTGDGGEVTEVASATVLTGAYGARPLPLPALVGEDSHLPYESGELFHGPSFQVMESLVQTSAGASSVLRATTGVPSGRLNPGLLDGATHGIPHAELTRWDPAHPEGMVAYPAFITEMQFYGATPEAGTVRCEVRPDGHLGSREFPAFAVQLIGDEGVWCTYRLIESCFPKGPIGDADPIARRAFLRDRKEASGIGLSQSNGHVTELNSAQVEAMDWLPGTVANLFGTTDAASIARQEHIGRAHGLHPSMLPDALPLHSFDLATTAEEDGTVRIEGDGLGQRDLSRVRTFWSNWFDRGPWPVEDLYYGLTERFLGRVVLTDPGAFAKVRGRSVLYLANHQVGVESLLFSILASALGEVPTVTLAKAEHRTTWLGRLIAHCFDYPGVEDPRVISFFDRSDKASLPAILKELAAEMAGPGRSVMVHIEGTRSLDCRTPVAKMSGAFLDMAIATGAPIVPVRFVGGLPTTPLDARIEFPLGLGRQDIYFGSPIDPQALEQLHYGARKDLVLDAINSLGPDHREETPLPPDPEFAAKVDRWQQAQGVSHEHAVLREVLAELTNPGEEVSRLLAATDLSELNSGLNGPWLAELGRRLLGLGTEDQ